MIILSYNSRGLGRGVKWTAIRRNILKHKVDIVCIQETKKESFSKGVCQSIWGELSCGLFSMFWKRFSVLLGRGSPLSTLS